eukprot:Nitzschia sp. Nitz4//scaffold9_size221794//86491//89963//NITZ4_001343-RA/size221794-snap-gene-0.96-mRNA-1//1//CDS//3329560992//4032//frame0
MVTRALWLLTLLVCNLPVALSFQSNYGFLSSSLRLSTIGAADQQVPTTDSHKLPHFTAQFEPSMIPPPGNPSKFDANIQLRDQYLELSVMRKQFRSASFNLTERAELLSRRIADLEIAYVGNQTSASCPNESFYAVLVNAYANAAIEGGRGLELIEPLAQRFEYIWGVTRGARIQRGMVKAWLKNGFVSKAMDCLDSLLDQYALTNETRYLPDSSFYDSILFHLSGAAKYDKEGVQKCSLQVYQLMRERYGNESEAIVPSDRTMRNLWKCQKRTLQNFALLEQLRALWEQQRSDYKKFPHLTVLKPTARLAHSIFMEAKNIRWNETDLQKCTSLLEGVLQDLYEMLNETGDLAFLPNPFMHHALVRLYRGSRFIDTTQKTIQVLYEMHSNRITPILPTLEDAFTILTRPNRATAESTKHAEIVLGAINSRENGRKEHHMQNLFCAYLASNQTKKADHLWKHHLPVEGCDLENLAQFVKVLSQINHNVATAAEVASTIVDEIYDRYRKGTVSPESLKEYSSVFSRTIRLWSRSNNESAFLRILDLLDKVESINQEHPLLFRLNKDLYVAALDTCEKHPGHSECGTRSLSLLNRMYSLSGTGRLPSPDPLVLTSVLSCLFESNESGLSEATGKVFSALLRAVDLDRGTTEFSHHISRVSSILHNFCSKSDDESAIQTVLHFQKALFRHPTILPNNNALTTLLHFLHRSNRTDLAWDTYATYRSHVKANPRIQLTQPFFRTMAYLGTNHTRELSRLSADVLTFSWDRRLNPDVQLFNFMFETFRRSVSANKFAAVDAYRFLQGVEKLSSFCSSASPNIRSYELVAAACTESKIRFWHKMVKSVFFRARHVATTQFPMTRKLYHMAIAALQHDVEDEGSLEEAENLLIELETLWKNGREDLAPEIKLYNSFLAVYARCPSGQRATRANILFNKAIAANVGGSVRSVPNTFSYNAVIRAIAYCKAKLNKVDRLRLFSVALDKFKALHHSDNLGPQPNCVTYVAFAQACKFMLPKGDTQIKMIRNCFDLACQNGYLTDDVLNMSYEFLSDETKSKIPSSTSEGQVLLSTRSNLLPKSWTCNVPSTQSKNTSKSHESE